MKAIVVVPLLVLAAHPAPAFQSSIHPLSASLQNQLTGRFWRAECPVPLKGLRVLTVSHWGFDGRAHTGQLVVNQSAAAPLERVFQQLYKLRFRIHHLRLRDVYGAERYHPADNDVSGSFECREAVPSPCSGGSGTGTWSMHAYGMAVDLNPIENPYTGCGRTRERSSLPYLDRARHRLGMVTPAVVRAFRSIGWGWGGDWSGTKDYMHFSATGH